MEKENEREIWRLVNVLRLMARLAEKTRWAISRGLLSAHGSEQMARYGAQQYNRILDRLKELDPALGAVFSPLAEDTTLEVLIMACGQLAAYYEDKLEVCIGWEGPEVRVAIGIPEVFFGCGRWPRWRRWTRSRGHGCQW